MSENLDKAVQAKWRIVLYRNVLRDPLVEKFLNLLKELNQAAPVLSHFLESYCDFASSFVPHAARLSARGGRAWEDYILGLILADENLFSLQAESGHWSDIPQSLVNMARQDLAHLQVLARISSRLIREAALERMGHKPELEGLPDWEGICLNPVEGITGSESKAWADIRQLTAWEEGLPSFAAYYRENGVGLWGACHAFRWVSNDQGQGRIIPVKNPDPIRLDKLYEYEKEQARVIMNTEQFVGGYPANNVLLYGDRGTGKSSTVKALLNKYGHRGLRLIEIKKQDLRDFPELFSLLSRRPQKFILFIDDLSFAEQETEYRELKALLEGGLEQRPANVLIYATSNRRHLVQEKFSDRLITGYDSDNEDVRYADTQEEKLSLADRFGLTVTFASPDQKRYLAIVEKMAGERGLDIPREELHRRALRWEMSFNSRSGRTARQFIDHLEGQLGLEKERMNEE